MKVRIASPLVSYTQNQSTVEVDGESIAEILNELNVRYPGIRFRIIDEQDRIRPHMQIFINTRQIADLTEPVESKDVVHIIAALSGG